MGDRANDPVDHARTTRKHAGQNWKNTRALPALIAIGVAAAVIFTALYALASGETTIAILAAVIAAVLLVGGFGWLRMERRRVRRIEIEYARQHPETDAPTPTS